MKKSVFDKYGIGLFVVTIGVIFLLNKLDWIDISIGKVISYLIPIAIIWYGVNMIIQSKRQSSPEENEQSWNRYNPKDGYENYPPPPPLHKDPTGTVPNWEDDQKNNNNDSTSSEQKKYYGYDESQGRAYDDERKYRQHDRQWFGSSSSDTINKSIFIGDIHFGKDYWELRPMNLSSFIGDFKIDLTRAHIPNGETKIVINGFISDIKLYIPNGMDIGVQVEFSSFIGDCKIYEEKRSGFLNHISHQTPYYRECEKKLYIVVNQFIGDVKIKKVG